MSELAVAVLRMGLLLAQHHAGGEGLNSGPPAHLFA